MRKLLYLICLLSIGQIFSANQAEEEALTALLMLGGNPSKRPAHTDGKQAAKRRKVPYARSAQNNSKSKDSESSQGEDEEFLCKYCGQDLDSRRKLNSHEENCYRRPDLLKNLQDQNDR